MILLKDAMNSKDIGNITEAKVLAILVSKGYKVLLPWGDNLRYDIAFDVDGTLVRVQCKTATYKHGAVTFKTASSDYHRGGSSRHYVGQADYFGIYCPALDTCYLVPVASCGKRTCNLRVIPAKIT